MDHRVYLFVYLFVLVSGVSLFNKLPKTPTVDRTGRCKEGTQETEHRGSSTGKGLLVLMLF